MVFKDKRVRNRTDLSDLSIATRASLQAPAHAGFLSFNILSPCELVSQLYLLVITIYGDKLLHYKAADTICWPFWWEKRRGF